MAWERLNKDDVGLADNAQAQFDRTDAWSLVPRNAGDGVIEGLVPTTTGTDMDIDLSAGWVQQSGVPVSIGAGAATIGTADVTNPRIDVIVIDTSTPSITVRAGTPAAAPESPTLTTGDIPIAEIFVAANDADLAAETITDLRVPVQLAPQIEEFTGNGTWTKPAGATFVRVIAFGPGGGGGSGRVGATSTMRGGGGGGGCGGMVDVTMTAAACGATETVTVGTGGAGGASPGSTVSDGNVGTGGSGASSFGTLVKAGSGAGGAAGTSSGGANGGNLGNGSGGYHIYLPNPDEISTKQGDGNTEGNQGETRSPGAMGSGGGGGGYNSSNSAQAGGAGGGTPAGNGGAGVGGAGTAAGTGVFIGGSGGGGGHPTIGSKDGGAGGGPGGGGGGGCGTTDGTASGAGGAGADGRVVVMTW